MIKPSAIFINVCAALLALLPVATASAQEISENREQLTLAGRPLLDARIDGFMSVAEIKRAPDGRRFVVIACGYECTDNVGFLFNADGGGKQRFTGRWDSILQTKLEWSADSKQLYYYRINSTGADPPANAPREGWVAVNVQTLRKQLAVHRQLKPDSDYGVFNLAPDDRLNVRTAPGATASIVGALDRAATGIKVTGPSRVITKQRWVPIRQRTSDGRELTGWVNQSYLYEVDSK